MTTYKSIHSIQSFEKAHYFIKENFENKRNGKQNKFQKHKSVLANYL